MLVFNARHGVGVERALPPSPPSPGNIGGTGSVAASLSSHPKTTRVTIGNYYVSPLGSDSNPGTFAQPFKTIGKGLSVLSNGETLLVRAGTYSISSPIVRNTSWATGVLISGYGDEIPRIDGSALSGNKYGLHLQSGCENEVWSGFEIVNVATYPVLVQGKYNKLDRIYIHDCCTNSDAAAFYIHSTAKYNVVQDSAVFKCGDPVHGGTNTFDGAANTTYVSPTPGPLPESNVIVRCFFANTPDDGVDFYRAKYSQMLDCAVVAGGRYFGDGSSPSGVEGHGVKMGGGSGAGYNLVKGSVFVHCRMVGQNGNGGANMSYEANTSSNCNVGIAFRSGYSSASARNILVVGNTTDLENNSAQPPNGANFNNSWKLGITLGATKFVNPSQGDYSLDTGSAAIGAGTGGSNLGASTEALSILKKWWNHSKVWIPGRGNGPGGTGLVGDIA